MTISQNQELSQSNAISSVNNSSSLIINWNQNDEVIENNIGKAFYSYQKTEKAAKHGYIEEEQFILANILADLYYNCDEGTEKYLEQSYYWYKKAAENGYNLAQYKLANLCPPSVSKFCTSVGDIFSNDIINNTLPDLMATRASDGDPAQLR
ncbi:700_t:CDS:2, partial [Funneliformis geosporum]